MSERKKVLLLGRREILACLEGTLRLMTPEDCPDLADLAVINIAYEPQYDGLCILVEHESFDDVPMGEQKPTLLVSGEACKLPASITLDSVMHQFVLPMMREGKAADVLALVEKHRKDRTKVPVKTRRKYTYYLAEYPEAEHGQAIKGKQITRKEATEFGLDATSATSACSRLGRSKATEILIACGLGGVWVCK